MKRLKVLIVALSLFGVVGVFAPAPVASAAGGCNSHFLTFPAWYDGLQAGDCSIKSPGNDLTGFIWKIALNVLNIMLQLVGYISFGYIIFGGYKYLTSAGSSDQVAAGRKTIINAVVGLILSFMSVAIVSLIAGNL